MPGLEETIRRLSASFAEGVIAALKDVPLDELLALSAEGGPRDAGPAAAPRARRARVKRSPSARPDTSEGQMDHVAETPAAAPGPEALDAAERIFAERGSRGATVVQLGEVLAAQGVSPSDGAADVIRVLVEREIIRDAGFRRTTGKGTAPVFVSCR